jgi:N-acetylmuramoyl-L-alanine amidase
MEFIKKYEIVPRYLSVGSKRRSGKLITPAVKFIVAHDTGNPTSTAKNNTDYFKRSENEMEASAHLFVDDKEILECVPALTVDKPEKAWHVLYGLDSDNKMFGCNANDAAIGVEYCYGKNINADEAYKRYVWLIAFICFKFNLDPKKSVVGHFILNPGRKTDPKSGLAASGRTYEQLLKDVPLEYEACLKAVTVSNDGNYIEKSGTVRVIIALKLRKGAPNTKADQIRVFSQGDTIEYVGWVNNGESVNGNSKWFKNKDGNYFWSGGVSAIGV